MPSISLLPDNRPEYYACSFGGQTVPANSVHDTHHCCCCCCCCCCCSRRPLQGDDATRGVNTIHTMILLLLKKAFVCLYGKWQRATHFKQFVHYVRTILWTFRLRALFCPNHHLNRGQQNKEVLEISSSSSSFLNGTLWPEGSTDMASAERKRKGGSRKGKGGKYGPCVYLSHSL